MDDTISEGELVAKKGSTILALSLSMWAPHQFAPPHIISLVNLMGGGGAKCASKISGRGRGELAKRFNHAYTPCEVKSSFRAKKAQLKISYLKRHGQNLALTVLHVPHSLNNTCIHKYMYVYRYIHIDTDTDKDIYHFRRRVWRRRGRHCALRGERLLECEGFGV